MQQKIRHIQCDSSYSIHLVHTLIRAELAEPDLRNANLNRKSIIFNTNPWFLIQKSSFYLRNAALLALDHNVILKNLVVGDGRSRSLAPRSKIIVFQYKVHPFWIENPSFWMQTPSFWMQTWPHACLQVSLTMQPSCRHFGRPCARSVIPTYKIHHG